MSNIPLILALKLARTRW